LSLLRVDNSRVGMWGCRLLRTHPGIENLPLLFSTRGLDTNRLFPPTIMKFSWRADWIRDSTRLKDRTLIVIGEPCGGSSKLTYRHTIYVWSTLDTEWIQSMSRCSRPVFPAFGWVFAFLPFNTKPSPYPFRYLSSPIPFITLLYI